MFGENSFKNNSRARFWLYFTFFILPFCFGVSIIFITTKPDYQYYEFYSLAGGINFYCVQGVLIVPAMFMVFTALREKSFGKKWERNVVLKLLLGFLPLAIMLWLAISVIVHLTSCVDRIGPDAMLRNCEMAGLDLNGADLRGANLIETDLSGADLTNANLSGANLSSANLSNTNLTNVKLNGAKLLYTNFENTVGINDEMLIRAFDTTSDNLPSLLSLNDVRLESREEILKNIQGACLGEDNINAGEYFHDGKFHPIVLLDENGAIHEWSTSVDKTWEPKALRFSQIVLCVDKEQDSFPSQQCAYGGGNSATSYTFQLHVRLIAIATGTVVKEDEIESSYECPDRIDGSVEEVGDPVDFDDVEKWLLGFVNPPAR